MICIDCELGKMLDLGVVTVANDSCHRSCTGTISDPCECGCKYSKMTRCRTCGVTGRDLDSKGSCQDSFSCTDRIQQERKEAARQREIRLAADPKRKPRSPAVASSPVADCRPTCLCGCLELTKSGHYRPGHDSRHVSDLIKQVKAGSITEQEAKDRVSHSSALVSKVTSRLGK